ncbi:glutathione S-transferase [Salipiger thiooxidans]|uniref:Glutathione S-transferase n=1 Tax=Salipiger thiooxidans TaxID=282683 RepID=A0A1G7KWD1_9RHOB|nr:glutathione S-transferase family protein [Salipiger thiooxidans]SDF41537.1 glutathione S-transferase [Salipiger thiooxidans]
MGDCLILGDYTYSSWSLRGWLLMERFGLPFSVQNITFLHGPVATQVARIAPARTVPALVTDDGTVIWDSLAMAEELASRHPEAGHWPSDAAARATARSMAAEMHSSYGALREQCPMNLQAAYTGFTPSEETLADLARIEALWAFARGRFGDGGPWLFGRYSAADAFFAPVAARIAGYGLPVGAAAAGYVAEHLADPAFRRWRAMGIARGEHLPWYDRPHDKGEWPGPAPRPARAVETGTPENAACPYSGEPVTDLLEMDGRVFGFCNPFCRDMTMADPTSWPAFTALL